MYLSFCIYFFLKLSINTQLQFQDDNKKHERGVFILELQIGKTYILTEDEKRDSTGTVFIKKGSRVLVKNLGSSLALVQDLSAHKNSDGIWSVKIDKLVTEEEYAAELEVKNKHYVSDHQPIETMQSNMTHDEMIGFLKGNIIKYACRCGKKDEPLKEAEKIKQYAEWLCIVLSGGTINPRS